MSVHQFFRREPVPAQAAQHLQPQTIPAPLRGLVESENLAYMQPGGAVICDNWAPTLRGTKIRGGSVRWCDLHSLDTTVPPIPSDLRKPVVPRTPRKPEPGPQPKPPAELLPPPRKGPAGADLGRPVRAVHRVRLGQQIRGRRRRPARRRAARTRIATRCNARRRCRCESMRLYWNWSRP